MKAKLIISTFLTHCLLIANTQQLHAQVSNIDTVFPLNAYIGGLVHIKGSNMHYTKSVTFNNTDELIISITDTEVVSMVMPGTTTGYNIKITSISGGQSIYADEIIIHSSTPPIKQLGNKLYDTVNQNGSHPGEEGFSVAISADGNTAVAGGDFDNNDAGAVWVYTRSNNVWTQQVKLTGTGAVGSSPSQGYSIAISADGNTLIEGGVGDNGFIGAAWIFTRDKNGVWSQQGNKLVGSNSIIIGTATPEQGYAVSLSADGNSAIVGGRRDNNYIGAAWIFTRSNNVWTEQQKIVPTGYISTAYHQGTLIYLGVDMGTSVALSADGNTALIGGPVDNNDTGAVWVFTRSNNVWIQQSKLIGTGGNRSFLGGIQQGTSCAINADGNTAIIGAPFDLDSAYTDNTANYYNGAVWIFTRSKNIWSQQGNKLFAADAGLGAEQGWSVSLSGDGNTAIAGAPGDNTYTGAAWVYTRNNNVWKQSSGKLVGTGYVGAAKEGWSASISADGNTAIIGGPEDYYQEQGAVWMFADTSNNVLAVSFINFKAYLFNKGIQTTWTGFNETNISGYDVERSNSNFNFIKLANVATKAKTTLQNNYTWFDGSPISGNNFYRIKATSKDRSVQYSSIIKIDFGNIQGSIAVYPNPVYNKEIHLQLNNIAYGIYTASVYNMHGESLYRKAFQLETSNQLLTIDLKNAAAGIYTVEVNGNNKNYHATLLLK